MTTPPLISVIVPVWNGARYLADAIGTIRAEAHPALEIVVVDDGSTDGTAAMARAFGEPVRVIEQTHAGVATARNTAIRAAHGAFIAFLDVDDLWPPGRLAAQLARFAAEPGLDIVTGRTKRMLIGQALDLTDPRAVDALEEAPGIGPMFGAALIRRAVFDKIGLLDTTYVSADDLDWFIRAKEAGLAILVLDRPTLIYRQRPDSLIHTLPIAQQQLTEVLKRSLDRRRAAGGAARKLADLRGRTAENPPVSAILIVKNGERYLAGAIESVLAGERQPLEIIVVDGGSTDRTAEIAGRYPLVRLLVQEGTGTAAAYNQGIAAARGEILAFISHDDRWTPSKLALQVRALVEKRELAYTIAKVRFFLEPGHAGPPGFRRELLEGEHVGRIMETLVARRSAFSAVGPFDPSFQLANDVDWFARANDRGLAFAILPEVLLEKRIHDANTTDDPKLNNRELLRLLASSIARRRKDNDSDKK